VFLLMWRLSVARQGRYIPGLLGEEFDIRELTEEFNNIKIAIDGLYEGRMEVYHQEPEKPDEGVHVYADGIDWNPGGGKGYYEYTGAGVNGWRLLSTGVQY